MTATFHVGDAITVMNTLPEKSVDLVLSSPPFLALRSYLPADHPDKKKEGGSQATPGAYIDWLVNVVEACARILAPHGSMCFELGDTYAGSGGNADLVNGMGDAKYGNRSAFGTPTGKGWPLAKSLSLIPELFRLTLVYGTNPLTGRQTERWRLRNVIRWVRPNPPVGALGDKFRPATSELMVFCKSAKRFFDLDAVREPNPRVDEMPRVGKNAIGRIPGSGGDTTNPLGSDNRIVQNPAGAPPLDWWNIPPGGFSGAHYAVWPPELCVKPIKAMCPEKVCRVCGEPSRRITETARVRLHDGTINPPRVAPSRNDAGGSTASGVRHGMGVVTLAESWSDCRHNNWRRGVVLDPFGGTGTTAAVATGHGRDAILIDLDERNYHLALERVGPLVLERGEDVAC